MKYSFLSSQIWHKNVFKFFKFSDMNLSWGGQALIQKRGQDGGNWQNFCRMGDPPPQSPQEKSLGKVIVVNHATRQNKTTSNM